jgi:hypothetical protein
MTRTIVHVAAVELLLGGALAAMGGSIPVVVDHVLPDARPGAPVKFGVPFPEGAFKVGEAAQVVDDRGRVVSSQTRVTATWDPKGEKGVRWLLVEFLTDTGRQYRVVYGSDLVAGAGEEAPIAKLENGRIELNTGFLSGTIATNRADLFGGLKGAGMAPVVLPDNDKRFCGFFVEHETRGVFRADLDPAPRIVLEETGPIRATVKLDGVYANAAGETFCRYSIRAHFFRGRGDVKLDHTFIFTGASTNDRIRSMGLQLPRQAGQRGHVWGEGDRRDEMSRMFTSTAKVVQDSPNHDTIELLDYPSDGGAPTKLAGRSLGSLAYDGVTLAIRDAWQQYPWGFEVRDGLEQAQLWPSGGRLLDTSFDGYWWFLDEHQKRFMLATKRGAKDESSDDWIARYRRIVNATGAAKTHELWVTFEGMGYNGGRLLREVANPVIAGADPAWSTSTRALDFCAQTPRNDALFGDEERYLDAVLAMVRQLTEDSHWYGWWDWGGYYQLPGYPTGPYKDTHGLNTWHRNRPKSHYGWGQLPWLQYFRTGERKWLRYAQTYTLYSADRAHVHHGTRAGYEYHYDNSDIPWVGGYVKPSVADLSSNLQQKDDYVYMYWLTGERRALDVLEMWGESVCASSANTRDVYFKWAPGMARGNDIRNAGQQLHRLMMLYQATWDERYLKIAQGVADSFARIDSEAEVILAEGDRQDPKFNGWRFHTASGWAYEGLWLYYKVTGDERIKKTLLAFIERSVNFDSGIGWGYGAIRAYSYGYELTRDTLYLDMIRGVLDDVVAAGVTPEVWITGPKFTTIALPRAIGAISDAPEAWRAKHLPTSERGRTLRFRYAATPANPPYTAPAEACFREERDRAWRFRLLFDQGGQWVVLRPDGTKAYESPRFEAPFNRKWLDVEIPADGRTGAYVLRCVSTGQPGQESGSARVLRSDLPVVVRFPNLAGEPAALTDPTQSVFGRSLFFAATNAQARVHVVPRVRRDFGLFVRGRQAHSTRGTMHSYLGGYTLPLSGVKAGELVELRPLDAADCFYPLSISGLSYLWFDGVPPFVAANPEDYFVPDGRP